MVLQDIYANSIGGRIIDRKEELKFGNGIRPVLKLRNPKLHGDDEAQQKLNPFLRLKQLITTPKQKEISKY